MQRGAAPPTRHSVRHQNNHTTWGWGWRMTGPQNQSPLPQGGARDHGKKGKKEQLRTWVKRRATQNNTTRKNIGIATLKKNSERGEDRRRRKGGRGNGISRKGHKGAKEGNRLRTESAKGLHGERNEAVIRRGGDGGVMEDLAGFSGKSDRKRSVGKGG